MEVQIIKRCYKIGKHVSPPVCCWLYKNEPSSLAISIPHYSGIYWDRNCFNLVIWNGLSLWLAQGTRSAANTDFSKFVLKIWSKFFFFVHSNHLRSFTPAHWKKLEQKKQCVYFLVETWIEWVVIICKTLSSSASLFFVNKCSFWIRCQQYVSNRSKQSLGKLPDAPKNLSGTFHR